MDDLLGLLFALLTLTSSALILFLGLKWLYPSTGKDK